MQHDSNLSVDGFCNLLDCLLGAGSKHGCHGLVVLLVEGGDHSPPPDLTANKGRGKGWGVAGGAGYKRNTAG